MRLTREHLTFKALCVLDEAVEQAQHAPVEPSAGLRLALAYLWSVSRDLDRAWFDEFWRSAQGKGINQPNDYLTGVVRFGEVRRLFNAIARSVGFEATVGLNEAMRKARGKGGYPD